MIGSLSGSTKAVDRRAVSSQHILMLIIHINSGSTTVDRADYEGAATRLHVEPIAAIVANIPGLEMTEVHISPISRSTVVGIEAADDPLLLRTFATRLENDLDDILGPSAQRSNILLTSPTTERCPVCGRRGRHDWSKHVRHAGDAS